MKNLEKKTAVFFDIDGTLFRDSLLVEHFKKLIRYEMLDEEIWVNKIKDIYESWSKRQEDHDNYLEALSENYQKSMIGFQEKYLELTADQVIKTSGEFVYRYTRTMIKWHKEQGHLLFFISGSPDYLVKKMGEKYGVTESIGSTYKMENGMFTGEVIPMWDAESKNKKIDELVEKYNIDLDSSYAYGDTNGDLKMIYRVGNGVAINPSMELLKAIQNDEVLRKKATIIVERKDVLYKIHFNENLEAGLSIIEYDKLLKNLKQGE